MTGTEILAAANLQTEGDTITDALGLSFINECLMLDMAKDAHVIATQTPIVATADAWYALPADIMEIIEIARDSDDVPYYGTKYGETYRGLFDIRDGNISFAESGTYTIKYFKSTAVLAALANTPAINALLHYPIAFYVAARWKLYDDEDSQDAKRLMSEYQYYKQRALTELQRLLPSTGVKHRIRLTEVF